MSPEVRCEPRRPHPPMSSRNELPLMILNPPEQTAKKMDFPKERCIFLQKNAFSDSKMHFHAENAFHAEKMHFLAEKYGFRRAHGRKPQESVGGVQGSRIKNASQLSQDNCNALTWHAAAGSFKPNRSEKLKKARGSNMIGQWK